MLGSTDARRDESDDQRTFPQGPRASPQSAGSGATRPAAAVRARSQRARAPARRGAAPGAGSWFPPGPRAARLIGECRSCGSSFQLLVSATPNRLRPRSGRRKVDYVIPASPTVKGRIVMGKAKAKAKQVKGKLKETVGSATGDKDMQAEGRGEQMAGKAQETTAKVTERLKKSGQ